MQQDLTKMTQSELEEYLYTCEVKRDQLNTVQHSTKILLNSLYGALGTPYFRMYDIYQATGITLSGQAVVSKSYEVMNDFINGMLKVNRDWVVASDTDSVVGDSKIFVSGIEKSIAAYYDSLPNEECVGESKYVKSGLGTTLTYHEGSLVERKINYAMKHKVKKRLYKITIGNDSVIVTEDHSVKAIDEFGQLVDVKPQHLTKKHKLINISSDTDSIGDISNDQKCLSL